jgi:hypothetical protein
MEGIVTAYNTTTNALSLTVDMIGGSGAFTAWNVNVAGQLGATWQPIGVTDGSNAPPGYIGEWAESDVPMGTGGSLAQNQWQNATSLSLAAGDWDVSGNVVFNGSGPVNSLQCSISTTSASGPSSPGSRIGFAAFPAGSTAFTGGPVGVRAGRMRISSPVATTVYLDGVAVRGARDSLGS